MRKRFSILIVSLVIAGVALSLAGTALISQANTQAPAARKIVVFSGEIINEPAREALVKNFGGEFLKELPLINGMAVLLPPKAEAALADHPAVLRIDNDDVVFALGKPTCDYDNICEPEEGENPSCSDCKNGGEEEPAPPPPEEPTQTRPWGVDRIDANLAWSSSTGQGVKVAILDTGIDIDHPDLDVAGGVNVLNPHRRTEPKYYDDDNGHGTHVAGIAGASNNDIGVVGVAPDASLYAVKAFNRRAIGFVSDIVDGIDWSITNEMQVINMSFGELGDNSSLRQAIEAAYDAGIVMVAAAGNDGDDFIYYPARYPQTIAVSATCSSSHPGKYPCNSSENVMDEEDGLASFSSYATSIEQAGLINLMAAPGQAIKSTWNDGSYYEGNGTSMATPHIVGTAALVIQSQSGVSTVSEVMNTLKNTAEDLDPFGLDIYFGYGLADAEAAIGQ